MLDRGDGQTPHRLDCSQVIQEVTQTRPGVAASELVKLEPSRP